MKATSFASQQYPIPLRMQHIRGVVDVILKESSRNKEDLRTTIMQGRRRRQWTCHQPSNAYGNREGVITARTLHHGRGLAEAILLDNNTIHCQGRIHT